MHSSKRIHFIGIGGVGMSAIAWVLLKKGIPVSGSDLNHTHRTSLLEKNGAHLFYEHNPSNLRDVGLVVISSAITEDNPELAAARRLGLPVLHRSTMLAEILEEGQAITVTGTHGKTTTTAMLSLIMEKGGLDPTVLIGGDLADIGGNAKLGQGPFVLAEADESDGTFLSYSPQYAILTNIELDHLDFYSSFKQLREAFRQFLENVDSNGYIVLCADDPGVRIVVEEFDREMKAQGRNRSSGFCFYSLTSSTADFYAGEINLLPWGSTFNVYLQGRRLGRLKLPVPGRHNVSNALAALSLGHILGVEFEAMQHALAGFHGTGRRFQIKGEARGVMVIDDYAHHPTEVAITIHGALPLKTTREGRIITIFQPHRFSRTKALASEFAAAFDDSDIILVTDVYAAGEQPIPGVSGKLIFDALNKREHPGALYIPDMEDIPREISKLILPGDIVFTMGAGNIWSVGESLLKQLAGVEETKTTVLKGMVNV